MRFSRKREIGAATTPLNSTEKSMLDAVDLRWQKSTPKAVMEPLIPLLRMVLENLFGRKIKLNKKNAGTAGDGTKNL